MRGFLRDSTLFAISPCSPPDRRLTHPSPTGRFRSKARWIEEKHWTWSELHALPSETVTRDIHCVTKWSKLDTTWEGVSVDTLLEGVETAADYVMAFCDGGYTTNLPLEDLTGGKAWVAFGYDGQPLEPEHGGPARLLVPHLYFWKSAKWVRGLRLVNDDEPGFWETLRLPHYGDPWQEQRYQRRLSWRSAESWTSSTRRRASRSIVLDGPDWPGHLAGQHVDVRLTAEDGYQAQRSYSIASRTRRATRSTLTVERLDDGEVSPYLAGELRVGDKLELRGPIGGYFVWEAAHGRSAAAGRRRVGHLPADGHAPPPAAAGAAPCRPACCIRRAR